MIDIKEFEGTFGFDKLISSLKVDCKDRFKTCNYEFPSCSKEQCKHSHNYFEKIEWILNRAKHYAEKTRIPASQILDRWERQREYWYMNFYQECNQPEITEGNVIIVENCDDFTNKFSSRKFRCPACGEISTDPQVCNSGKLFNGKICNWKSYGLFHALGKGIHVFLKDTCQVVEIFKPIELELENSATKV